MDKINMSLIWTMLTGTVLAVTYMFSTFAKASDVERRLGQQDVNIAYGQYYDRFDDWEEALAEDRKQLAKEYKREMERLKAIICEHDPEWERCGKSEDDGR